MSDADTLRQRMIAAGVDLPAEVVDLVLASAGPLISSFDALLTVALGDLEPFLPTRRLPDDAAG